MSKNKTKNNYSIYIIGAAVILIAAISFANTGDFIAIFEVGISDGDDDLTKSDSRGEIRDSFLVTDDSADESSEQTFEDEPESPNSLSTPIRSWSNSAINTIDPNDVHISIGVNPRLGQYLRDGMIYGFNHATGHYSGFEIYTDHYIKDPNTGYSGNSIRFLANGPNEYLSLKASTDGSLIGNFEELYLYRKDDFSNSWQFYGHPIISTGIGDMSLESHKGNIYLNIYDGIGAKKEISIETNVDNQDKNILIIGDNMNDYIKNADGTWIISTMNIVRTQNSGGNYILDYYEIYSEHPFDANRFGINP